MVMAGDTAFHKLRPLCIQVAEKPCAASLTQLQKELFKVSSEQLQLIQEYIIFPLKLALLRDKRPENDSIALVNCLRSLLSLTEINNWQMFMDLFLKLFLMISSQESEIKVCNCSEDLKLSVVECVKTLLENTHEDIKKQLYEKTYCPALGHSVFILLQLSQHESLRSLRIASMKTITLMFGLNNDLSSVPKGDHTNLIQARLAAFLPGICIAMAQVATADVKQGQAVTVAALETWFRVVVFCLSTPGEEFQGQGDQVAAKDEPRVPEVKRTQEWIDSTASKLQILLKKILPLVSHPHHKVRMALTNLVGMLLLHCRSSFQDSFVPLVECSISMTNDSSVNICKKNKELVAELASQTLQRPLVDTLEDSLYSLATRLPRLLRNTDEKEKLVALNLLAGYITILDNRTGSLLRSSAHLKRLSHALIVVAQPDVKNVPLVLPTVGTSSTSCLKFEHFTDNNVLLSLKECCCLLGLHGDISVLVDVFLELGQKEITHQEGAVLVLNFIAGGTARRPYVDEEAKDAIKHCFDVYMSPWLWADEKKIILKGLLLEGLTAFAQVLDVSSLHLQDLLCLFLEQAGANSPWVVQTAKTALDTLSQILQHNSVDDMVFSNGDYLVHSLSLKLIHFSEYPALPGLLRVLFASTNQGSLLLFQDLVQRILSVIDVTYGSKNVLEFLKVLFSLMETVQKLFPSEFEFSEKSSEILPPETSHSLANFLLQRKEALKVSQFDTGIDSGRENSNEVNCPEDPEAEKSEEPDVPKVKPLHIQMTCQILEECAHLLRSEDVHVILTSLQIIQCGLSILSQNEDDLLPMIHRLWGPFKDLFKPTHNPVVISKALESLLLMARLCRAFIQRRTVEGVWQHLIRLLEKQLQMSIKKQNSGQQMYRLTVQLLSKLGNLAQLLQLEGSALNSLCHVCLSFLESDSRSEIVTACVETLSHLQDIDPNATWWWLTRGACLPTNIPPLPSPEFRTVRLPPAKTLPESTVTALQEIFHNKQDI